MCIVNKMLLALVVLSNVIGYNGHHAVNTVNVAIYYESLCPDTINFFIYQLAPAMNQLYEHLVLTFVPFGFSQSINDGLAGFQCQHGPAECLGNLVQDCALNQMKAEGQTDFNRVNYLTCEMQTTSATRGDFYCVNQAVTHPNAVYTCVHSDQGRLLQLTSERLTKSVPAKFIPTIIINNVFDQEVQDLALQNLFGVLCRFIPNAYACQDYYNRTWSPQMYPNYGYY